MAKTKAKDQIQLADGRVMTLGEALDRGILRLKESVSHSRRARQSDKPVVCYLAWDEQAGVGWDVGKTLYLSRTGKTTDFA